jgi:hypothetical protein
MKKIKREIFMSPASAHQLQELRQKGYNTNKLMRFLLRQHLGSCIHAHRNKDICADCGQKFEDFHLYAVKLPQKKVVGTSELKSVRLAQDESDAASTVNLTKTISMLLNNFVNLSNSEKNETT